MRHTHTKDAVGWRKAAVLAMVLMIASLAHAAGGPQPVAKSAPASAADPHPAWPDNGIAQRKLPGAYMMFVEHDKRGGWHAWAMDTGDAKSTDGGIVSVKALDFFSGKILRGRSNFGRSGQDRSFTDAKGIFHKRQGRGFEFFQSGFPAGMSDAHALSLSLVGSSCSVALNGIGLDDPLWLGATPRPKWIKVPLYRLDPDDGLCTRGTISSDVQTVLDLGDGTFLATMTCWVFRLRKSDLSPVGAAPALRIVDAFAVHAAIERAKGRNIQDASDHLSKALGLSFDAENACKDAF